MVRSNLAVLLAERNLKITKLAHDTGISRTTLTALAQNNCKGIQFDTVNTICSYLNINPGQLIAYCPIDVDNVDFVLDDVPPTSDSYSGELYFDIYANGKKYTAEFFLTDEVNTAELENTLYIHSISISEPKDNEPDEHITDILKKIPRTFITDIEKIIIAQLPRSTDNSAENDYSIQWQILNE